MQSGSGISRAHRACAECKAKKLRCVPSREEAGVCSRCHENGISCTIPEAARPRKRQNRLHTRMLHLEEMMSGLVDRLSDGHQPYTRREPEGSLHNDVPPSFQGNVVGGIVSLAEAKSLCDTYRQMSQKHFPCVIVPVGLPPEQLERQRPMLFQAMLVVASFQNRPRQIALERVFLKDLGEKFFMQGERSLDFIQGLLVYLTWYHFNVSESGQYHAYRLASLCATMVVDLGINRKAPRGTTQHDLILNSQSVSVQASHPTAELWSHEAKRALVGAYIQSTLCALMCRKQQPLVFTSYMEECALSLQRDGEVESDKMIIYYVRLLRILNEIYNEFKYGDPDHTLSMSDDKVQVLVKTLEAQLSSWRASLPPGLAQHAQLNTWGDLVGTYAHEIGLHGNLRIPPASARRVTIMFDCLAYIESYMKRALSLSLEDMQTWTAFDWRQLTYSTILASKISAVIDAVTTDGESTARIAQLDADLGVVVTRTQELFAMTNTPPEQSHYFQSLLNQWKGVCNWYQSVLQRRALVGNIQYAQNHADPASQVSTALAPRALEFLDTWPDDNFGIMPTSGHDFMLDFFGLAG